MRHADLTEAAAWEVVRDAVALVCEAPADTVVAATRLIEDLHADSLALVEIVEVAEDAFRERGTPIRFDDGRLEHLVTVSDLAAEALRSEIVGLAA